MLVVDVQEKTEIDQYFIAAKIPFERRPLEEGDYTNETESFLLERKRGFDLLNSLKSKHIFVQLARMREKHPTTPLYVLFEGDFDALINSIDMSQPYNHGLPGLLKSFGYTIAHIYGAQFIKSWSMVDTITILQELDKYTPNIKSHKVEFEPIHMEQTKDERVRNLLTVPKLGQNNAQKLLTKYENIFEIISHCLYHPKEVLEIEGIGKGILENLINMFIGKIPYIKKINLKDTKDIQADRQKRNIIQQQRYKKNGRDHV